MNVPVFVPSEPHSTKIRPGSGIVGSQVLNNGRQMVYYEGNLYGARDLQRYVERISLAWGRMVQKYPTTAKAAFAPEDLVIVGEYDPARMLVVVLPEQRTVVKAWLGLEVVGAEQLVYRNPLLVKSYEQFLNIVGDLGTVREFHVAVPGGSVRPLRAAWNPTDKIVRVLETPVEDSVESLIARGRLYLTFPSSSWGTGW